VFAAALADPSRFVLFSEWESQEALDAHYRSEAFADFSILARRLARPAERADRLLARKRRPAYRHSTDGSAGRRLGARRLRRLAGG
jgi:hypothetical protein